MTIDFTPTKQNASKAKIDFTPMSTDKVAASLSQGNELWKNTGFGEYFKAKENENPITTTAKVEANTIANTVVGGGKMAVGAAIGTAGLFQGLGQGILNFGAKLFGGKGGFDTKSGFGVPALDSETPEGQGVQKKLQPSNTQQAAAGYGEIAGEIVPGIVEGLPALKNLYKSIVEKVSSGKVLTAEERMSKEIIDTIAPKLTKKEAGTAVAEGRGKPGGLFSKGKITPDDRTLEIADVTKNIVKPKVSFTENVNNVRSALETEAESLKSKVASADHPYSYKELGSHFKAIEPPISIKGTAFEKQIDAVKDAALRIAKKNGGTVSSLFDTRKEFDALVSKEYPSLYDKESAPMRNAITSIRNTINDFIESNLPEDVGFKDSLKKQSLYYDAIDNMSEKAASEEVGKTGLQQKIGSFTRRHPIATTLGAGAAGTAVFETAKSTISNAANP